MIELVETTKTEDVINFYAAEHHLDNREAVLQVCAPYGLEVLAKKFKRISHAHRHISSNVESVKNLTETEIIANDIVITAIHLHETDYFTKRGISYEIAKKYNYGYIEKWIQPQKRGEKNIFLSPRVIIPTSNESYVARSIDDNKVSKMEAGIASIFNIDVLKFDVLKSFQQHVVLVEGEFDALSIIEAGNDVISLGSASNVDKLIAWLREKNIRLHLPLVLNLDADEAGQNATDKFAAVLRNMHCKDQNESLVKFRDSFFQFVADIPNKVNELRQ